MIKKRGGYALVMLVYAILALVGLGGCVANIVKLISHVDDGFTLMAVLRVVGIFAAPFGAILGFF